MPPPEPSALDPSRLTFVLSDHALRRYVGRICPSAAAHSEVARAEITDWRRYHPDRLAGAEAGVWVPLRPLQLAVYLRREATVVTITTVIPIAWHICNEIRDARRARHQARAAGDNLACEAAGRRIAKRMDELRRTPEWARYRGSQDPVKDILAAAKGRAVPVADGAP